MFVWYHYFEATEWYNWIRIYIGCYVWMTGFGKILPNAKIIVTYWAENQSLPTAEIQFSRS